jgi:hypothetical protein
MFDIRPLLTLLVLAAVAGCTPEEAAQVAAT